MSILPLLLEMAENYPIGYTVYPEQIQIPRLHRHQSLNTCSRPMCTRQCTVKLHPMVNKCEKVADLNTIFEKDGFHVSLEVKNFAPHEIAVKTIDQTVVVEGKHEEKEDEHGHISRHFIRKYTLPQEIDVNNVISTLSTDGQLIIKAPPISKAIKSTERVIQIQQIGVTHQPSKTKEADKLIISDEQKVAK